MSKWKQKIKVIAIADTFAVGAMHVMNQMIASSAVLKNILKPGTGKYYNWKMGNIFYHKSGNGAPLLLIHDLNPFSSGYEWSQLEDQLKKIIPSTPLTFWDAEDLINLVSLTQIIFMFR